MDSLIEIRHKLHRIPELGLKEQKTSSFVRNELEQLGLEVDSIYGTGLMSTIYGKKHGKTILIRADMDGLPIREETGVSFCSENEGVMHACGHDFHMTCAIGVARKVIEMQEHLSGNVKLMFQPCEENVPGGAKQMIEEGILNEPSVDVAMAIHVFPEIESGKVYIKEGGITSSPSWFEIELIGQGGHASYPEKCNNPLELASEVIMEFKNYTELQKMQGREILIVPTVIKAGDAQNIIPKSIFMKGTVRTFSKEDTMLAQNHIEQMCKKTVGKDHYQLCFRTSMESVVNDKQLVRMVAPILEKRSANLQSDEKIKFMGGDDYAYISDCVPSLYFLIGCKERNMEYPLHSSRFLVNDNIIENTVELLVECVTKYLSFT